MIFRNRSDAGQQLAAALQKFSNTEPIILALPRGGVAVAYEVAKALHAPLDVMVVRKLGAPQNPELGIGAITLETECLNQELIDMLEVTPQELETIIQKERQELERRIIRYQAGAALRNITSKTVILIDDGLATGITAKAAIEAVFKQRPQQLIFAVPVGSSQSIRAVQHLVNEVVCLYAPDDLMAVGNYYQDFEQVSDDEVMGYLRAIQHSIL